MNRKPINRLSCDCPKMAEISAYPLMVINMTGSHLSACTGISSSMRFSFPADNVLYKLLFILFFINDTMSVCVFFQTFDLYKRLVIFVGCKLKVIIK